MTDNLEAYRYYSLALEKGNSLYAKEAIALYEKAVALDPGFAMAYARIGYTYSNVWGFPQQARPYLAKAFALSNRLTPKDRMVIAAWYTIANVDYEGAIRAYRQLISSYPAEAEWYRGLAYLSRGEHRYNEGVSVIQQALALDPENPENYNQLAFLYAFLNRQVESVEAAKRYVALSGGSANSYDTLGTIFHLAGQYSESERVFLRALQIKPDFEIPSIHLAALHMEMGKRHQAVSDCERYLAAAPSDSERRRGRHCVAEIYWDQRDIENLRHAYPDDWTTALEHRNFARARNLLNQGPFVSARGMRVSRRAQYSFMGRMALMEQHDAEALTLFRTALTENLPIGAVPFYEDCLADGLLATGRLDEAIAEYRRVIALYPNNAMMHYHFGTALDRQGKRDLADAEFRTFLQLWKDADPDIPELIAAKKRIA